jgi:TPR repeat protein
MVLLHKAAVQGHAHAMYVLGTSFDARKQHEKAVKWITMAAEAGLPAGAYTRPLISST